MRLLVLAIALSALLSTSAAQAGTNVFLQNNTALTLDVHTTETGAPLAKDKWGNPVKRVLPGQRAKIVWFNRDSGIKNGKTYVFRSRVSGGGKTIDLLQQLRGKLVGSHMWIAATGRGYADDNKTRTVNWNPSGHKVDVVYRSFFTGSDDNIEYIFRGQQVTPPAGKEQLNVLAYNIYMRPTSLFKNGQSSRAGLLPRAVKGYDAIIFSEAFDDDVRKKLLAGLRAEYPFHTRILGTDRVFDQDGGVIIVSKWKIEHQAQERFKKTCAGSDCMSDKGVVYARINKQGRRYHLFGSHTQAWPDATGAKIRRAQFKLMKRFIDAQKIPASEAVIIGGDLNVDMAKFPHQHQEMLTILGATQPRRTGHNFTFDPTRNKLASGKDREYLDYVLFSKAHKQPRGAFNEVRILRSHVEWKEFVFEKAMWDLSDHFPVFGRFEF